MQSAATQTFVEKRFKGLDYFRQQADLQTVTDLTLLAQTQE